MHTSLITGGGRGIGRAIALAVATPGHHTVVTGRHQESLQETAVEIRRREARATAVVMDVAREESVASALASLRADAGFHVDVLVNNAGVGGGATWLGRG